MSPTELVWAISEKSVYRLLPKLERQNRPETQLVQTVQLGRSVKFETLYNWDKCTLWTSVYNLDKCVRFGKVCPIWTSVFDLGKCVKFGKVCTI